MTDNARIVGIFLVKNEDQFIKQAISNVLDFCDEIIVSDNQSQDKTGEILKAIESKHQQVKIYEIDDPAQSQDLVTHFVGTNTWIFGVDGDEIYDPQRLSYLRKQLQIGDFSNYFRVVGNVLHCTELDGDRSCAKGYLAPPSRSMTKLFNFAALRRWDGPFIERLHGGNPTFIDGFDRYSIHRMHHETSWEQSDLRCLHVCFLPRSSVESGNRSARLNIMEQSAAMSSRRAWIKTQLLKYLWGKSDYKRRHYMRGPVVEYDARPFFVEYQGASSKNIDAADTNS